MSESPPLPLSSSASLPQFNRYIQFLVVLLAVALRLVWLRSDPYRSLDWSAGMLTDEGFYIHNSRNVALFGYARTDEFNNMLLSPWLHYLQVGMFQTFGVGSVQARLISVVASLFSLWVFWAALHRAFGSRVAWTATLFLGLDHTNLLFNRMALMDTPATLPAVLAFYCFVRGAKFHISDFKFQIDSRIWFAACGLFIGFAVTGRSLCGYLIPVPFIALWCCRKPDLLGANAWRAAIKTAIGILIVAVIYVIFWYLPHQEELSFMLHQYRVQQIQPHSFSHLLDNIYHSILGDQRGLFPYLFRHTPIIFALVVIFLGATVTRFTKRPSDLTTEHELEHQNEIDSSTYPHIHTPTQMYLTAWLLLGWLILSVISYSPSRYYVSTYPAMCALAAIALWRLPELLERLGPRDKGFLRNDARDELRNDAGRDLPVSGGTIVAAGRQEASVGPKIIRMAIVWLLVYHLVEAVVHRDLLLNGSITSTVLYAIPTVAAVFACWGNSYIFGAKLVRPILTCWIVVDLAWLGHWAMTLDNSQYRASLWLEGNLPSRSVLIGDPAPGLCLDNEFVAVNVIRHLCNTRRPLEQFAGKPRYVTVVKDSPLRDGYWNIRYPGLLDTANHIATMHALRWDVEIYKVPDASWLQ